MRLEINASFHAQPFTGSGQYLTHLTGALRAGHADIRIVERKPPAALGHPLGKVIWEQLLWPLASLRPGPTVRHVPYLAPPLLAPACVVTAHDAIPYVLPVYASGLPQRLYGWLTRLGIRRARAVIADSEWTRRDLIRVMGVRPDRIYVIPLGVDGRFSPGAGQPPREFLERYGLPERFALYLGSLDVRKNLGVLMRAWPRVWDERRLPLVVAGRAPRAGSRVRANWFEGLDGHTAPWLRRLGAVPESDKPELYRAASLFVFPSRYEGFGFEPLEAMASGVPVVSADATALPEVVGDAGVLVDPDDSSAWTAAILEVTGDASRAERLRMAGRARAREFTWERTAAATRRVYEEVAT